MKIVLIFFTILITSTSFSQTIAGKIVDKNGIALSGVIVRDAKINSNVTTNLDGRFVIQSFEGNSLMFTITGFSKVTKNAANDMIVTLYEATQDLNEVIVIGYGTKKKGSITGAVSQIKSSDILKTPAQSAIQSIQGKAAGVNIITNDEPSAKPTITIRGLGTVLGGRSPLYVIDGIESESLNGISANDIETLDLLKDASSTAIYGQKGVNGVVIVTTKKGKKGQIKITYDGYYGQKSILKKVAMSDAYRFAYYNNVALGSSTYFNLNQSSTTYWLDEITRIGEVSNHSLSMSGANENVNYYIGISNYTEKGILIGTDFKRNNIINKNEFKFSDKFKITQLVSLSIEYNQPKPLSAFTNAYKQSPFVPVRYANGRFGVPFLNAQGFNDISGIKYNNVANPVAQIENTHEKNNNIVLFGALGAELQISKNLKFNSNFGATANWAKGYTYLSNFDNWLAQNPSLPETDYILLLPKDPNNTLYQRRSNSYVWNWDNYLTYKTSINNIHNFNFVVGSSRTTSDNTEVLNASRINVPLQNNYWYLDFSNDNTDVAPKSVINNNQSTPVVSLAYFARFEYDFKGKYLLSGTIRREGVSKFQETKRVGYFPSISAGWVISKEKFLENNKFINLLKLRAGYGQLGNGNGPTNNSVAFNQNNYPFGTGQVSQSGIYVTNAIDPNLTWEKMKEIDFGLDFILANNHLTGTIDYYNRQATDLILPVTVPFVLSENETFVNAGTITNSGMEFTLRWDDSIGQNFKYSLGGNLSKNKNEVSQIDNPFFRNFFGSGNLNNGEFTKLVKLGQPLGSFYVYKQTGYDAAGEPVYDDLVDGNAGLTNNDRVNAGSYIPDFTYGMNVSLYYKNFDFSIDAYGVGGNKIYNGKKAQRFGGENIENSLLDSFWTPSTPNAINPKPFNAVPKPSTYYIENGDYLRINNLTIGFTLPKMIKKIDKVRMYFTAVNPFIFTQYSGYSPEVAGNDNGNPLTGAGIELDVYPTNKTYLFGVNLSL